jgi:hypothetical protein
MVFEDFDGETRAEPAPRTPDLPAVLGAGDTAIGTAPSEGAEVKDSNEDDD